MAWYSRHDEDLALTALSVTASAEDPGYLAGNLIEENAAKPAKLTTTSGGWVLEFDDPISPVAAAIIYQYLDAGLEVRLQANTSDSWGAPPFNKVIVIPAKRLDGPVNQRWTVSPWIEFAEDEPSYAFWRLQVVGTNSQNVAIGRLLLPSARHLMDLFVDSDMPESDDAGEIAHPTELGVETIYVLGGPRRSLTTTMIGTDLNAGSAPVQQAADFRALHESSEGRAHPFLLCPFDTNDVWLVRPESAERGRVHKVGGYQIWSMAVREVSRGTPWP